MTRLLPLSPIIWVPLFLAYVGAIIYVFFWLDAAFTPVQSLPLIFWILVLSLPLIVLVSLLFSRRISGARRPPSERDATTTLISGAVILMIALVSSLETGYVTGFQALIAVNGCGMVMSALIRRRLARTHSKAVS